MSHMYQHWSSCHAMIHIGLAVGGYPEPGDINPSIIRKK